MKTKDVNESRRNFLQTFIPAGGMLCFGCHRLLIANSNPPAVQDQEFSKRIQTKLTITHEELFDFRFKYLILRLEKFSEYIGRDKVITMLKRTLDDINQTKKPNLQAKSVKDYINPILESENHKIRNDIEVLELTDNVCQLKITNCLWAKTFREMNAGDLGYANTCYGDFSSATAFNPKLKLERTKTLMEGHDCCDFKYIWNG